VPGTPLGARSLRGPDHARLVVCEERIGFQPWLRNRAEAGGCRVTGSASRTVGCHDRALHNGPQRPGGSVHSYAAGAMSVIRARRTAAAPGLPVVTSVRPPH